MTILFNRQTTFPAEATRIYSKSTHICWTVLNATIQTVIKYLVPAMGNQG